MVIASHKASLQFMWERKETPPLYGGSSKGFVAILNEPSTVKRNDNKYLHSLENYVYKHLLEKFRLCFYSHFSKLKKKAHGIFK